MSNDLAADLQRYLIRHYPDVMFSEFSFLTSGWECDIYAFRMAFAAGQPREFIIRLYAGQGGVEKARLENDGIRKLHRAGYPVPEMFLAEEDVTLLGRPFIIMEKLDGQNLWPLLVVAESEELDRLIRRFSHLLAQLHGMDWHPYTAQFARYDANPIAILDDMIDQPRQLYLKYQLEGFLAASDWLDAHKTTITVQPAVVHLDFHANNVFLRNDGRMAVIDWSQLSVSDFRCDLSWTLQIMGEYGGSGWREGILKHYVDASGRPVEDLDYFDVVSYLKNLVSDVISLRAGPESLGLRSEMAETIPPDFAFMRRTTQRIKDITGLAIPEVEAVIREFE